MASNQAVWIKAPKAYPLEVGPAPYPTAGPGEVIIKNEAVALNPVDWQVQTKDFFIKEYPFILGSDVAGYIEEVGQGVTHLKKGQRVIGYCIALGVQKSSYGAYQLYPTVPASLVCPIPDNVSFEQAVVLPLAITTAAVSLYHPAHLALSLPSLNPTPTGKTVLVWGGSSSVGATAIQLLVASGFEVVAVASASNHTLVKSLGAAVALDYNCANIVNDAVTTMSGRDFVAVYDAISEPATFELIGRILDHIGPRKLCCIVPPTIPLSKNILESFSLAFEIMDDVGASIREYIWQEFLPKALAKSQFQFKPNAINISKGLETVQGGLDKLRAGVSAKKLIIQI